LVSGLHLHKPITKRYKKAFALWQDNNKMDETRGMFERISNAEINEWLPHYYIAQINSLKAQM
jgi:hypothetical protein